MKQYITWIWKIVNWGIEHPNTHDQDKAQTDWKIDFVQYWFEVNNVNLAVIEYDESIVSWEDLIAYANIEPLFNLTIITEEEVNTFLANIWDITVKDFVFTDNRPLDIPPTDDII